MEYGWISTFSFLVRNMAGLGFSGSPILLPFSLTLLPSVLRKGNKSGGISEVKTFLDSYNINIGKKT